MFCELSELSQSIIIDKVKCITEDVYVVVKSLPIDEFGVFLSVLIEMWCKKYGIDVLDFLDIMETATMEAIEKDIGAES